jgi:hypothetical protein
MHTRRDRARAPGAGRTTICRAVFGTTVAAGLLLACAEMQKIIDAEKSDLFDVLRPRYHNSISDALADLGRAEEIGRVFVDFQRHLYEDRPAA